MINVGIVGGGTGGTSLLRTLMGVSDVNIIGIADVDTQAPGLVLARQYNISTTTDFIDLVRNPQKKIIIDATGQEKVKNRLHEIADHLTEVVDSSAAHLMVLVVKSREEMIVNLENQSGDMAKLASEMSATMQQISASSEGNVKQLYEAVIKLAEVTKKNNGQLEETYEIINFIKKVAAQTKLLGLNASIEASRAGNEGLGFNVVAGEIRKLADDSAQSTQRINGIIEMIKSTTVETEHIVDQIKDTASIFAKHQEEYSSLLRKVAEQVDALANNLDDISRK